MTSNQIRNLPEGALLKRKIYRDDKPRFGLVVVSSENDWEPGVGITMAWEQESHSLYNDFDFSLDDEYPEAKEQWRDPIRWRVERILVENKEYKTWWRNWKRIA